jgi:hypothetical protein
LPAVRQLAEGRLCDTCLHVVWSSIRGRLPGHRHAVLNLRRGAPTTSVLMRSMRCCHVQHGEAAMAGP